MEELSNDLQYSDVAREKASNHTKVLTDANFLAFLHLELDILNLVATQSLHYQRQGSTQVHEYSRQKEFVANLKLARQKKGENFLNFLQEVKCTDNVSEKKKYLDSNGDHPIPACGTIAKYERSKFRLYKKKELKMGDTEYTKLSPIIQPYINNIIEKYEESFLNDAPVLKLFEIFDPDKWKKNMPRNQVFYLYKFFNGHIH